MSTRQIRYVSSFVWMALGALATAQGSGSASEQPAPQHPVVVFFAGQAPLANRPGGFPDSEVARLASLPEYTAVSGEGVTFLFHRKSLGLDALEASRRVVTELLRGGHKANGFELDWNTLSPESRTDVESLLNNNPYYRANGGSANLRPVLAPLAAVSLRKGDKQLWELWHGAPEAPSSRQASKPVSPEDSRKGQPKDAGRISFEPKDLDQMGVAFLNTRTLLPKRAEWIAEGTQKLTEVYEEARAKLGEAKTALVETLLQGLDPNFNIGMFQPGTGVGDLPEFLRENLSHNAIGRLTAEGMSEGDAEAFLAGATIERFQWDVQIEFRWTTTDGKGGGMSINLTP